MKTVLSNMDFCCGCGSCSIVCSQNAISMISNSEGFIYPQIDEDKCVNCNNCMRMCPQENREEIKTEYKKWAFKSSDDNLRKKSTSGGMFSILANYIIKNNGKIYATKFLENLEVRYSCLDNLDNLSDFRSVKYVQSCLDNTFKDILNDLLNGKLVMFIGTACYVESLKKYISLYRYSGKLLLIDIICHGVPSPLIWNEHVNCIEKKYKDKIVRYNFRDKDFGWHGAHNSVEFSNKRCVKNTKFLNAYTDLYFAGYITRKSCHCCLYTNYNRPGDITLGDCWGIEKNYQEFDDDKGISIIITNTAQGREIFEIVKQEGIYIELDDEECNQAQLCNPSKEADKRESFWNDFKKNGYSYVIKKYTYYGNLFYARSILLRIIEGIKRHILMNK